MKGSDRVLQVALRAARAAGRVALARFRRARLKVDTKKDGTPVSEADRAADRALRREILRAFPTHGILSEESEQTKGDGRHLWIVDPIDGTAQFLRGFPYWAVLVALEVEGRLETGVIHAPAQGVTYWARRGKGAYANGRRLRVSRRSWRQAWMVHGWLTEIESQGLFPGLGRLCRKAWLVTGASDALGYAAVAEGRTEAFVEAAGPAVWDLAAPRIIVEEAGGRFTNLKGEPSHRGPGAVASNGSLHAGILSALDTRLLQT